MFLYMLLTTAILGFSGSLHCAVMCGPIACMTRENSISYYVARSLSYTFLGFFSGLLTSIVIKPRLQEFSSTLALYFGLFALLFSLYQLVQMIFKFKIHIPVKSLNLYSSKLVSLSKYSPFSRATTLGVVTAFLPCGFLYLALIQSALFADPLKSGIAMFVFSLCTAPALWLGSRFLNYISSRKNLSRYIFPIAGVCLSFLLIWRGLGTHHAELYKILAPHFSFFCH